jgi:hypothetical protein
MTVFFDRRAIVTLDTIQFTALDFNCHIKKSLKPEPNTCELTVFNLNEEHVAQLELLRPKEKQAIKGIPCKIEAGYAQGVLSQLWLGDLRTLLTTYDGPTTTTVVTSGDGEKGWKNAKLHVSFGPKTPLETALRAFARSIGVGEGNLSKVVKNLKQAGSAIFPAGVAFSGSASRQLIAFARSADLEVSVQDGGFLFLDRGKALAGSAIVVDREHGMIGSPTVDNDGVVEVKMLLNPDFRLGGVMQIKSKRVQGAYRAEEAEWDLDTTGDDWTITARGKRY